MTKNLGIKIIALLVSVLIWVQITLMAEHETKVKLRMELSSDNPEQLDKTGTKVPFLVKGRGLDIVKLNYSQATVRIAASDFQEGNDKNFTVTNLPANHGLNIIGIDPEYLGARRKQSTQEQSDNGSASTPVKPSPTLTKLVEVKLIEDSGRQFFPDQITLKVRGTAKALTALPAGIKLTPSATALSNGLYSIVAELPPDVTIVEMTPASVRMVE